MNTNRTKGHNYERKLVKEFKSELSYSACTTSRYSSRLLDDCKIDLNITDFNIQAKNVKSNINYCDLVKEIKEAVLIHLPERAEYITAIFHKKLKQEFVVMSKLDFYRMANKWKSK